MTEVERDLNVPATDRPSRATTNEIDVLIDRVADPAVRAGLRRAVGKLRASRKYGLVFENHVPERVLLPEHKIRRGSAVVRRSESDLEAARDVVRVSAGIAKLAGPEGEEEVPVDELCVVAEFGDPIFPGLRHLGSVHRGGDKPAHMVIKGENYHALEALRFTHAGKVDCIYIDPPYNSGAKDWKYDNNYVDEKDLERHSKWLAFMERRIKIAAELLNPERSVLIVAIDEKEFMRIGLLLEQTFLGSRVQMVSTIINPQGTGRVNEFSRTNEFLFIVQIGAAVLEAGPDNMYDRDGGAPAPIEWRNLRRRENTSVRGSRPNQFYAVFVDEATGRIHSVGDPLSDDIDRTTVAAPPGTRAVFPLAPKDKEMVWGAVPETLRDLVAAGYARSTETTIQFLNRGTVRAIEAGTVTVTGRDDQGAVIAEYEEGQKRLMPKTVWARDSHNSQSSGSLLLKKFLPGRGFPFPKSLYAVEDVLRFYIGSNREAVVLDFFAGSGTTVHAVARLNSEDDGRRQAIGITNNAVSPKEAADLRAAGYRPGDPEYEAQGIFEYVTRPRVTAAITGMTPSGDPVRGDYKTYKVVEKPCDCDDIGCEGKILRTEFAPDWPMADGLEENAEFFELTYLDETNVELGRTYDELAPLLWLKAGGQGQVTARSPEDSPSPAYVLADTYAVLFDTDRWRSFVSDLPARISTVFVATDSQATFSGVTADLPPSITTYRLYDSYLSAFSNPGRRG